MAPTVAVAGCCFWVVTRKCPSLGFLEIIHPLYMDTKLLMDTKLPTRALWCGFTVPLWSSLLFLLFLLLVLRGRHQLSLC